MISFSSTLRHRKAPAVTDTDTDSELAFDDRLTALYLQSSIYISFFSFSSHVHDVGFQARAAPKTIRVDERADCVTCLLLGGLQPLRTSPLGDAGVQARRAQAARAQ